MAAPTQQYCGWQSNTLCANQTKAEAPCYNVEIMGQIDTECNYVMYEQWPNVTDWGECKGACVNNTGCESFQYYLSPTSELQGPATICYLYFKPVTKYTQSCSAANAQPLDTFFDIGCPTPVKNMTGKVPANPSANLVNGTCDGSRSWNENQTQWIANAFATPLHEGYTQQQCGYHCNATADCKSYFWSNQTFGTAMLRYHVGNTYPPGSHKSYTAAQCIFISQPVSEYTTNSTTLNENFFFDKHCPLVNEGG